jgi:murein DD-endopeptidase MepM/ murein hydrolase activator NlpD
MSKSERLSRRAMLKLVALGAGSLAFSPMLENPPNPLEVLDLIPEKFVTHSVWPIARNPETIMGDGKNSGLGYTHLMPTVNIDMTPDGGRHIGTDFNWGDHDEDCGTPLRMIMNGVCVFAADGEWRQLGKIAIFCHRFPDETLLYSRYAHLDNWNVEVGKEYKVGEIIGNMGKSGWDNGFCHLHLDLGTRKVFEEHYNGKFASAWWYPHFAPIHYVEKYFVDPAKIISENLKSNKPPKRYLKQGGVCEF